MEDSETNLLMDADRIEEIKEALANVARGFGATFGELVSVAQAMARMERARVAAIDGVYIIHRSPLMDDIKSLADELEAVKLRVAEYHDHLQEPPPDWRALAACTGFKGKKEPNRAPRFHMKHCARHDRRINKRKTYLKQICKRNA